MTQTAAIRVTDNGAAIDYTATADVTAGDVVEVGSIPLVACQAITNGDLGALAAEGVFDVPKTTDVFAIGDAVYWNSAGTDVGANTGAADNATGNIMGVCVSNAANTATHVRVKLTAAKRTNTIAGSVTADDITGSDSSLAVTGIAGNGGTGGIVAVAGGAGAANYAGGAITATGGAGGTGTSNGGAVTVTGGASGAVGGTGGAIAILSGAGDATNGTAGALNIDSSGTGATKGAITIGTNAASITMGKMPRIPVAAVNAAGGNIATATAVVEGVSIVAAADNSTGIQLPSCVDGAQCIIVNQTTDKTLEIYPPLGKQINGYGANNAITLAANGTAYLVSEGVNAYYGGLIAGIMS